MPNPGLAYKMAEQVAVAAVSSYPTAAAAANDVSIGAALRFAQEGIRKASGSAVATGKSLVDALGSDGTTLTRTSGNIAYEFAALPRCVAKTDGSVPAGTDAIFTVSGGPVRATVYGIVTTVLAGTGNGKLTYTTTDPAATVDLCSAVAIDNDASGTSYRFINTTAVLTPVTAGVVIMGNAFATDDTEFLLPIGSMGFNSSGAATGVIAWYIMYTPLSPDSRVVAAA